MHVPVQVTFRDLPVSDAVEARCWTEAAKLQHYCEGIAACHVTIAESHRRHQPGNLFEVRIKLSVPRRELVVNRHPAANLADEDIEVAINEAFDRMRRQLVNYGRQLGSQVKRKENGAAHSQFSEGGGDPSVGR